MPRGRAATSSKTVFPNLNIGHLLSYRFAGACQINGGAVQRINAGTVRGHVDCCRTVHRRAGSDRAEAQPGRSMHRLRDGVGWLCGADDRYARRLARSTTHCIPVATPRSWIRWRMLVLAARRFGRDLRRCRRQPVAAARADRQRAPVDPARSGSSRLRTSGRERRNLRRVCARRSGGVGDPGRRRIE